MTKNVNNTGSRTSKPEPSTQTGGHFQTGGEAYAQHRPTYPPELAQLLAESSAGQRLAVDVGCGSGQLSVLLADHFNQVIATDISADQLAHAQQRPNLIYRCEPAETMSADDSSADLIVAAQAAHWFDLDRFYLECHRVASPGAVIALVSYGVPYIEGPLNARFQRFYWQKTARFWPAGRHHVETGYAELVFPFEQIACPQLFIHREWNIDHFLDYIKTWSACRSATDAGESEIFDSFAEELRLFWGEPASVQRITWPIALRLGRV